MEEAHDFVTANKAAPFFLYLALTIPHANNERGNVEGNGMEVPDNGPYADKDWPEVQKNKAAMISRMDAGIGRLFERLKTLGIDGNTIVYFSSDNGPHKEGGIDPKFFNSGGGLRGTKRDLYEGGIRVPGIVRWPGHVPSGTTSNQVWAFWDVLPTLCELAGASVPQGLDGISMLPTLLGGTQIQRHEYLYWEFHERASKQAVRSGDWKGVRFYGGALELYNLKGDPAETKDVSSEHADVAKKLQEFMDGARTETPHWELTAGPK